MYVLHVTYVEAVNKRIRLEANYLGSCQIFLLAARTFTQCS